MSDDLRRIVLDASLNLIEEQGLEALSMREVARRAGVSHQAPYHHFGDREGILAAIATEGFTLMHAAMTQAVADLTDPVERLNAIGRAYVAFAVRYPGHFTIMFRSELVSITRHEELHTRAETTFNLVKSIVAEVAKLRGAKDPEPLVIASWALVHGVSTLLLEGKLDRHYGTTDKQRMAGADAVIEAFGELLKTR